MLLHRRLSIRTSAVCVRGCGCRWRVALLRLNRGSVGVGWLTVPRISAVLSVRRLSLHRTRWLGYKGRLLLLHRRGVTAIAIHIIGSD